MFVREVKDMNLKKITKVKNKAFIKITEAEIIFLRNVMNHLHKVILKMAQHNETYNGTYRVDELTVINSMIRLMDVSQQTERTLVTYLDHYKF